MENLANIVNNLTILTNGLSFDESNWSCTSIVQLSVNTKKIAEIKGESKVSQIVFEGGDILDVDGIFIAEGIAGGINFAKKLGLQIEGNNIKVNQNMETNIPGIYACGNAVGGLLQINKSAYEGAKAALSAVQYIKENGGK